MSTATIAQVMFVEKTELKAYGLSLNRCAVVLLNMYSMLASGTMVTNLNPPTPASGTRL